MKLSRSLLYVLILIFIVGIVLICIVPGASVWSRIATGLITGSFVGTINTLVNYFHQRREFFIKYSLTALNMSHELQRDFSRHKVRLDFFKELSREDIIEQDHKRTIEHLEEARKFGEKYEGFRMQMDYESYAPLFGLNSKRAKLMEELYDVVWQIEDMSGDLQAVYAFGMLAVKCSKEEQMLAIGNPDVFYEDVMQDNIDYRDLLVFNINKMAIICEKLQSNLKVMVDKNCITMWECITDILKEMVHGYVIRDVRAERYEEIEKELSRQ